jgi:hypothetical protein
VGTVSWADPGNRDPEREILERSPGWWSRALARSERLLPGHLGRFERLGWMRRKPRWVAALGLLVLAGAAVGVVVSQAQPAPVNRPPVSSAPDTGIVEQPVGILSSGGPNHITGVKTGSKHFAIVQPGSRALIPPAPCAELSTTVPAALGPGNRTVLGDVVVPPGQIDMLLNGDGVWRYWQDATFLVRGGSPPVTISVPRPYQAKAAIDLEVNGIGSTFHLTACQNRDAWTIATGGFYLKVPAACVPLRVQAGAKSATVWFGLGERCPKA